MRSSILSFIALCFAAPAVYAWHDTGHKLLARIAFEKLDESARQRVTAVLRAHPRFTQDFATHIPTEIAGGDEKAKALWNFQHASIWPDLVPNVSDTVRDEYHRGTWHYINLPVYLTEHDKLALSGKLDHNTSMSFKPPLRQGLNIVQALQGNLLVWRDETAPDADKAIALCWIIHLTGDIHEPLHNVALFSTRYFPKGDRGGNSIVVEHQPDNTNLHAVWDGLIRRSDVISANVRTTELLSADKAYIESIGAWSERGRELALEYVYSQEVRNSILAQEPRDEFPIVRLSDSYVAIARSVAGQQVVVAGNRLAALLSGSRSDWQ